MARNADSIRRSDVVLTLVLAALAVVLAVENVHDTGGDIRVDSHSWWMLPASLAVVAPLLVWRRSPLLATTVAAAVMALHILAFGWIARCGSGLPLAWTFCYLVGTRDGVRRSLAGLAGAEVLGALVLAHDSAAGPSLIPVVLLLGVGIWGIGRIVHQRSGLARELEARNAELADLRDARASIEVSSDRARLSAELDALLDTRLRQLSQAAREPVEGSEAVAARLATIETGSRQVLAEMREIVGRLRGAPDGQVVALAPAPSVASLDALLARHARGHGRLVVVGAPRSLPASVELSTYRVVEHLLGVLADDPTTPVEVGLHFGADALELTVSGRLVAGADVRAAVARARERVRLQHGNLTVKLGRGRARVVAQLPVGA
ncbi:hypothetical protein D9V37_09500 [Nocardioides mangrovicus]|uniref:Signal transduction histidine kinase n=1 Tax=Nocardioides mangrovicus TaxID=2478913 RepID=A0A3L8P128_9ACTN|nr:hypothetical protein [Nocardioides mangrovicus]RLV48834.1 hypothetical protein D9V37_09500 [Nocardioides mangrovicus]